MDAQCFVLEERDAWQKQRDVMMDASDVTYLFSPRRRFDDKDYRCSVCCCKSEMQKQKQKRPGER